MLCSEVLDSIRQIVNDPNDVAYPLPQKLAALNEGCRALMVYRPEATASTVNVAVALGSLQTMPADSLRLLKVHCNCLGPSGGTVGKSVRLMDLDRISDRVSDWQTKTGLDVLEYGYDQANPDVFWVYPSLLSNTDRFLKITYQKNITIANENDTFPLRDAYSVPVKEWALYSLFSGDSEESPTYAKAQAHQKTFFDLLNIKGQADGVSPSNDKARAK